MSGELYLATIILPDASELSFLRMATSNELLHFLVSPLTESATGYTLPNECLTNLFGGQVLAHQGIDVLLTWSFVE